MSTSSEATAHKRKSVSDIKKAGLLKSLTSRIRRTSLRGGDGSDHGFLHSGPWTVAAGGNAEKSRPCESVQELPIVPERSKLSLQNRRSIPVTLTLNSTESRLPSQFRTVRRTQSSPVSDVPPKIPERSAISLGLTTSNPKISPRTPQSSPTISTPSFLSPRTSKPLPPIPFGGDDLDEAPEELAPDPPVVPVELDAVMYLPVDEISPVTKELLRLSRCGYYWGPISRTEAEARLKDKPDGTFLLRNSVDKRYLLSLSFNSLGKTLHARIEYCNEEWSFFPRINEDSFPSVSELIEDAMNKSTVCYSRSKEPDSPTFPVRLSHPISRFAEVRSLAYLCRFVVRLNVRADYLEQVKLPESIRRFLA